MVKSIILCIFSFIFGVAFGGVGFHVVKAVNEISKIPVYVAGDINFHFLELGNDKTGDCTYIKAGDVDILIDAGSEVGSIPTITAYLNNYVKDSKLEYVIVTHAHEDHYAGFATNTNTQSIFDKYQIGTIIDFAQVTKEKSENVKGMYANYLREREEAINNGAKHFTALDCVNQTNGASTTFEIYPNINLTILNQKFYSQVSKTENDHSVCTLFTHGDRNFLFTGDLEEDGEESLVDLNDLPECELFKAGHHGSPTSSNDCLLRVIKPKICTVCCCAGTSEYRAAHDNRFPSQKFVNDISKYTDKVYVTTLAILDENKKNIGYKSMNGNIVVKSGADAVTVNCSNNNTILKNTEWFKQNRVMPDAWKKAS